MFFFAPSQENKFKEHNGFKLSHKWEKNKKGQNLQKKVW
jgi:hypothetical protein